MYGNTSSAGTLGINILPNSRISSNGKHSRLHQYLIERQLHLFLFSGYLSSKGTREALFKFYDNVLIKYENFLMPTLVFHIIPDGLEERNVILDIDEQLYNILNIRTKPELLFLDTSGSVINRTNTIDEIQIEYALALLET